MSSIDPSTPAQQEEKAPVPMTHPRWCDRSLCTAPEFVPTNHESGTDHAHRSVNLAVMGDYSPHDPEGVTAQLRQGVAPWQCPIYLVINDIRVRVDWDNPLLWAILDVHADLKKKYPNLLKTGRDAARRRLQEARS